MTAVTTHALRRATHCGEAALQGKIRRLPVPQLQLVVRAMRAKTLQVLT